MKATVNDHDVMRGALLSLLESHNSADVRLEAVKLLMKLAELCLAQLAAEHARLVKENTELRAVVDELESRCRTYRRQLGLEMPPRDERHQ